MTSSSKFIAIGLCAIMLPGCALHKGGTIYEDPSAMAVLSPTQGSSVHGAVTFVRTGGGGAVEVQHNGIQAEHTPRPAPYEGGRRHARGGSDGGGTLQPT